MEFARNLKELYNIKVTVIPNVVGTRGTVFKNMVKRFDKQEISGRIGSIQTIETSQDT